MGTEPKSCCCTPNSEKDIVMSEADGGGWVESSKEPSGAMVSPSEDATNVAACNPQSQVGEKPEGKTKGETGRP